MKSSEKRKLREAMENSDSENERKKAVINSYDYNCEKAAKREAQQAWRQTRPSHSRHK